jgi:hypothetical protein
MSASWRSSSGSPTRNGTTKTQAIVDESESTKEEVELTALSTDGSAEESEWKGNIFQWMEAIDSTRVSSPGSMSSEPWDVGVAGESKRARSAEYSENGSEPRDKRSRFESEKLYSDSDDGVAGIETKRARSAGPSDNGSEGDKERSCMQSIELHSDSNDGQEEADSSSSLSYVPRWTSKERREFHDMAHLEDYDGQVAKLEALNRKRFAEAGLGPGSKSGRWRSIGEGENKGD